MLFENGWDYFSARPHCKHSRYLHHHRLFFHFFFYPLPLLRTALLGGRIEDQFRMFLHYRLIGLVAKLSTDAQPFLNVLTHSLVLYFFYALHRLNSGSPELSVVFDGDVSALLELKGRVDGQLLAGGLPEGLCPADLARVALLLEAAVTLGATETKHLAVMQSFLTKTVPCPG